MSTWNDETSRVDANTQPAVSREGEPVARATAPVSASEPKAEKQSILKKEISFRRKGKGATGDSRSPASEPKAEKQSILKKEISFRRKGKGPTADSRATAPGPASESKAEKQSVLKKEISFRRKGKGAIGESGAPEPKRRPHPKVSRARPSLRPRRGRRVVGLKIGASQLAAATVVNNGGPHLVQVARTSLAPGVVVGGEVRDAEKLAAALKDFFKSHKLPKRNVRLGIATNRVGVRTFELPPIADPKQLANAIRFRAQEALPVPIDQAVLDYQVLEDPAPTEAPAQQRVVLVVTYRELVDRYVAACHNAGIQLAGIDLEAFALLRSLAPPRTVADNPEASLVAVSVGHDRSTLAVSDGRACEFTRVLEWGGGNVNDEIARALHIAPSEADGIKRLVSLADGDIAQGLSQEQVQKAREAIRQQVQSFARELVSSLQFYQEQPGSLGIAEIVLSGGTAHLAGFAEELQRLLNVPVRIGDPLARVGVGKKMKAHEATGSLAVAIGLGIED